MPGIMASYTQAYSFSDSNGIAAHPLCVLALNEDVKSLIISGTDMKILSY
jgi:hypothetical protein